MLRSLLLAAVALLSACSKAPEPAPPATTAAASPAKAGIEWVRP
jgi:hypothetical protein